MKVLIIRFSSIGDIVLTTPVIRCLKTQIPDAEIHFLTKPQFKTILESNTYVSKLFVFEDWKTTVQKLKKERYDYIIDLHHNLKSLRLKTALYKVPSFSFNKLNIEKWLLTLFKINLLPDKHIVDRYFETLDFFNIKNDCKGLNYFIPEKDVVAYTELPASHLHGFIAIAIGAAHNTKKLPVEKLKQLCSLINHPIILLGGKEDADIGNDIAKTDFIKIYNACGKFSLNESADLIKKSKFIITHDTGLMHIAAAFKKPVISVWGNTVSRFGMYPYYGNDNIENIKFEVQDLPCRPCSKIGYRKCPRGHFKCMRQQDINSIAATAINFLKHQL